MYNNYIFRRSHLLDQFTEMQMEKRQEKEYKNYLNHYAYLF